MDDLKTPAAPDPAREPGAPEPSADSDLYLRSYLLMRAVIGFMGIVLPVALLLVDGFLFQGRLPARGSLSAYYYSGMRDVFVGCLSVTGFFLITYRMFERNLDNVLSIIGGAAAVLVALFPTGRPDSTIPQLPLQRVMGESVVTAVHYTAAAIFILSLGIISFLFGLHEGRRSQQRDDYRTKRSPGFWRRYHWICTAGIGLAVAFIAVSKLTGWLTDYSLFIGETVAVLSFGVSWFMKGLELDVLFGPKAARQLSLG